MLNQELELSLNMAFARAREHRHEFMTVEHLLLALLSNPSAREALEACSVDLVALRQELEAFIEQTTPVLPATEEERDTQPTLSFQRVLQRAVFHVQSSGRSEVTGANVLVAIFSEQESQAAYLLRKHEVSRLDVVNFISHGTRKDEPSQSSDNSGSQPGNEEQAGGEERMENFTTNLNQLARVGDRGFTDAGFPHQQRVIFPPTALSTRSTLALCWQGPNIVAILKNASKRCSNSWSRIPTASCLLMKSTPLSVRGRRLAARSMRLT